MYVHTLFYYSPPADGMLPWPGKHPGHGRRRLLPKGGLSVYALCVLVCGAILYICFMAHHLARAEGGVGADAGMPSMLRRRLHNAAVRLSLRYEGLTQALGASRPTSAPETTHRKQQRKHASRRADGSSNDRRAGSAAPFAEVIPRAAQEGVSLPICPTCQSALAICITGFSSCSAEEMDAAEGSSTVNWSNLSKLGPSADASASAAGYLIRHPEPQACFL